jgi:hypothetical protein
MKRHPVAWQAGGALLAAEGWLYGPAWYSGWPLILAGVIIFFTARWHFTKAGPR